jgi:hypothetical protein
MSPDGYPILGSRVFGAFVFRSRSGEHLLIAAGRAEADHEPLTAAEARWALAALAPGSHGAQELRRFWTHHDHLAADLDRANDHQLFQALQCEVGRGGLKIFRAGGLHHDGSSRGSRAAEAEGAALVEKVMGRAKLVSFRGGHYVFATAANRHQQNHSILKPEDAQRLALAMRTDFPKQKAALEEAAPLLAAGKTLFLLQYSPPVFHPTSDEIATPSKAAKAPAKDTDWIEILVQDKDGHPYHGPVEIQSSDGRKISGSTDKDGFIRLDGITPGQCQLCLPGLDASAW